MMTCVCDISVTSSPARSPRVYSRRSTPHGLRRSRQIAPKIFYAARQFAKARATIIAAPADARLRGLSPHRPRLSFRLSSEAQTRSEMNRVSPSQDADHVHCQPNHALIAAVLPAWPESRSPALGRLEKSLPSGTTLKVVAHRRAIS